MSSSLIEVQDLGLVTRDGPVFSHVTFAVQPASLTAVVGRSGSGRSALLLAVCGRMRGLTGAVRLRQQRTRVADLRAATSVARVATLVQPEGQLRVRESVLERTLLDGMRPAVAEQAMTAAEELLGVRFDRALLVGQLDAYDRALLCVALATIKPADLVVLDDADRALDLDDQRRLHTALSRLAGNGPAVLVSTTEIAAVPDSAAVVHLGATPADRLARPELPTPEKTA